MVREGAPSTPFLWTNKGVNGRPSPVMTALCGTDGSLSAMLDITVDAGWINPARIINRMINQLGRPFGAHGLR
jgi:hypothetical protein